MQTQVGTEPCETMPVKRSMIRKVFSALNFFPKTRDFFGYFQRTADNIVAGAATLRQMITNAPEREALLKILDDQEHIGDRITQEVIEMLHKTFLTPIDREDIHRLCNKLDDIMDSIHATGNRLTLYKIDSIPADMQHMAEIIMRSAEVLSRSVGALRNLKNTKAITDGCIEIGRLENEADEVSNKVLHELFHDNMPPQQMIQVKELLENLERTTDRCKDVAVIIQSIVLKHS